MKTRHAYKSAGILTAMLLAVFTIHASGQTIWTDGASDQFWSSAANWNTGIVPISTTHVQIGTQPTGDQIGLDTGGKVVVASFTFNNSLSNIADIAPLGPETLQVNGSIVNNSAFTDSFSLPVIAGASAVWSGPINFTSGVNVGSNTITLANAITFAELDFDVDSASSYGRIAGSGSVEIGNVLGFNFTSATGPGTWDFFSQTPSASYVTSVTLSGAYSGSFTETTPGSWDVTANGMTWNYKETTGVLTATVPGGGAPVITVQPVSAVVTVGGSASLSVRNSGTAPFGYQWMKDGTILSGQTNSTLSFGSFKFTDSGSYSVVITNALGMTISLPASLSTPDASLWACGVNSSGQLGNGTIASANRPINVTSNVVTVAGGQSHSLFMKADGTLWAMGNNRFGQLGNGTTNNTDTNFPVLVASNVVAAAGGFAHSLFVKADGTLWAMGYNSSGQLGNGTTNNATLPVPVASNVVAAAGGGNHSLFVKADGTLWAMGYNSSGQLGNGTTADTNLPVQVASNVVAAGGGSGHSLFMKADGTLWAMGYNSSGQLGNGTTADTNLPVQVASNVVAVSGGYNHSLFVKADGTLWAMGSNLYGQLGNGTTADTNQPTQVTNGVVAVSGGADHALFVKEDGTLWAMGKNSSGQLGIGAYSTAKRPVRVVGLLTASLAKEPVANHSLVIALSAVMTDQTISFPAISDKLTTNTVGLSATASSGLPVSFSVLSGPASISGGTNLTFSGAGSVSIVASQAGNGSYNAAPNVTNSFTVTEAVLPPSISSQPVSSVVTTGSVVSLSVSNSGTGPFGYQWIKDGVILSGKTNSTLNFGSFKFTDSGSYSVVITNALGMTISIPASLSTPNAPLQVWGYNYYGLLGNGNNTDTNRPITVASNVVAVSGGGSHSLFVKADGTLWAMGYNEYGQLGNGTTNDTSLPIQVASNVVAAAGGYIHSLFVKADGTLWAMGWNNYGQLGNGTTANTNLPVQVASNVVAAASGYGHSLFVKADGTLWTMGDNFNGELGNGTTTDTNLPVQVASNVVAVAAGGHHSLFVKADSTLWAMGAIGSGLLGTNLPAMVASNVVAAAGGGTHSLFVKADGTLWAMGGNDFGQLGNGTWSSANSPVQVASNVVAAAGGNQHSLFVKADGTLWAMGRNWAGQLGNGTMANANRPVQVTGLLTVGLAKEPMASHSLAIALSAVMTDQTISFPAISDKLTTDTVGLTATASSGLPVSFSVLSGSASISGGTNLTFSGAGNVSIVASQAGDSTYNAAPSVTNLIHVYALSASSGAYAGGNTITITNGNIGTITNVLVGGVAATIQASGANWVTITLPATGSTGVKDIVIQTSDNGAITLTGIYTVNPAGMIGVPAGPFAWTNLGLSLDFNALRSLVASTNRDLYVLGYFTAAGGAPANNIAKWSGSSWTNLGAGINLIPYDWAAMAIAPNGDLYAGGDFITAGGITANYIAKWNGNTWTNLGAGMNERVYALASGSSGDLYAGGNFTKAGGITANHVAKWNGITWTNLGAGMNDRVYALALGSNGDLYAGGYFATADGTSANYVAKWNGSTWTNLGAGMNGSVQSLSVAPNGDLYAGGNFTTAGGTTANYVAKWNGSSWTNLGAGMNNAVQSLSVDPNGDLYAGGNFTTAGGRSANYVAKWNGNTWTNLGTGVNNIVYGLAPDSNGGVYAGGNLTTAGGLTVNGIAQWGSAIASVSGVAPSSGICTGGYPVTITGTNLCNGTDITNVTLCGVAAAIVSQSATQVIVTAAAGSVGLGDVRVFSTSYGETVKSNAFTYFKNSQTISFPAIGDKVTTDTVCLSATASSGLPVSFSVLSGSASISGGTNLTFTGAGSVSIVASQAGNGAYNAAPNVTNTFNVTAALFPPAISSQPVSAVVTMGGAASLSVSNNGTGPFGYQWLKDGVILSGQTNSTLSISSFKFTDSGNYSIVIKNAQGMTISLPANLSTPNAPLRVWGKNSLGQLGNGTTTGTNRPTTVVSNAMAVAVGFSHSLFVKTDGTLWAMGLNDYGQLGNGTTNNSSVPIVVASNVVAAAGGGKHSLFVKADGTLWVMGANDNGQLGNGTTNNGSLPIQVASNVVAAAGGEYHSLFVKADGTLWDMGNNDYGQLGNGTTATTNRPIQVASNVVAAASGYAHSLFVKADGTLWTMGFNRYGQLGDGTTNNSSLPIMVTNNVVAAAGGGYHSLFVKADGTLWAIGYNNDGELGNGTTSDTNRPVQVTNGVVAVSGGMYHSLFVNTDGTLWGMGRDLEGQLGNGAPANYPSPLRASNGGLLVASLARSPIANHAIAIAGAPAQLATLTSRTVTVGQPTNFTASVTAGDGPFTYQWQFNSTNMVNATNDSYTISGAALSDAGNYAVIVAGTYGTTTSAVARLTVNKAGQTITFPAISDKLTTDTVGLSATASSGLPVSFSAFSGSASISGGTNLTFTGAGSVSIVASQAGDATTYNAAPSVTNTFNVTKAVASVSLSNTNQTYDGTAKSVTATTVPSGKTVAITYNSSATVPTNAGSYTVVATVNEALYQGGATGTLTITKANQTVSFPNIGNQLTTNVVTLSATATNGLSVTNFSVVSGPAVVNGVTLTFTNSGSVTLSAIQNGSTNYNASAATNISFSVNKALALVSLSNTNQTYDGTAKSVTASTVPPGKTVNITYNGSSTAPTNAGNYTVIGTVNEVMYQGGATGTLTVAKANQTISFSNIGTQVATNVVALSATASSGLTNISFGVVSGPAAVSGNAVSFSADGTVVLSASQAGNTNWNPASTNISFTVSTVSNLVTYADDAKADDSGNGLSWATAKKTIQAAIDLCGSGSTVWVTNGTYSIGKVVAPGYTATNRICMINNVTVKSVNGPAVTLIDGSGAVRCAYLSAGTLSGFTLTNGMTMTDHNWGYNPNGSWEDLKGGGAYLDGGGTLTNCTLSSNLAADHGGGACLKGGGTLDNCTLSGNTGNFGGGAYLIVGGTLNNCTLSGNTGNNRGCGAYLDHGGTLNNCIVWGNSPFGFPNIYNDSGTVRYTCAPDGVTHNSNGCITNNPLFVSAADFHLQPGSPCINAGNNAYVTTTNDLAGNPRIAFGTVDMGAYESQIPPITVPVALSAVDITGSQFTARWEATDNATNYLIDVSETNTFTSCTGVYSNRSAGNVSVYVVTGLADGVTYYYRVRAANQYGTSTNSNIIAVPVSTNTPYVQYEQTNGVASAGSSDVVSMTNLFHGAGMSYAVTSNSNPALVTASFSGINLILNYTPGISGSARITIRATDNSSGFWVETTITVSVVPAPSTTLSPIILNRQNGLYEQTVTVSNTSPTLAAKAVTLTVTNLSTGARLYNATGADQYGNPEIQWIGTLSPLASMNFKLQYYTAARGTAPTATVLASLSMEGQQAVISGTVFGLSARYENIGGTHAFLIEFSAVPGRTYYVQYTDALTNPWKTVQPKIIAPVNRIQWIDSGPPGTECAPGDATNRFYRVIEAAE